MSTEAKTTMASLQNEEQTHILDTIDQMRDLGVNEDISIPQIVVVGDQSSGKSSTLQAITHMPLAVDSELCTRFATQIVLRRTRASSVKVSIISSSRLSKKHKKHTPPFTREFSEEEFNQDGVFAKVVNDAAIYMGLPTPGSEISDDLEKRFSGDVLKIEVFGPKQPHLSAVDVPGLFHNDTKHQTKEDLEIVRRLIKDYMDNPRSIILAVMDARVNISNQEVFRLAREADKDGSRTVGVITKCDALQPGDEKEALNIAQNTVERLTHGWFLVKNRSTQDIVDGVTLQQRDEKEKLYFQNQPWNAISKDRVGIESLTRFLSGLLLNHIRKEFPQLLHEIKELVVKTQTQLKSYGDRRETRSEQRRFLRKIAAQYEKLVEDSLNGVYRFALKENEATKLRLLIRSENEAFVQLFLQKGHKLAFKTPQNSTDTDSGKYSEDIWAQLSAGKSQNNNQEAPEIYAWIRKVHNESKGIELPGTVNPQIVTTVFRKQTEPWEVLSKDHLLGVKGIVDNYLKVTFEDLMFSESCPGF